MSFQRDPGERSTGTQCGGSVLLKPPGRNKVLEANEFMNLTQEILEEAERRISSILAVYIRGTLNIQADFLSRQPIHLGEWELNGKVFSLVSEHFGRLEIDPFACRKNRKVRKFFLAREQGVQGVDALAQSWRFGPAYAFPPLVLIPRVLQKLSQTDCCLILIAPWWPRRALFPTLVRWSIAPPLHLPSRCDLLCQGPVLHPDPGFLSLTGWCLRGRSSGIGVVRRR